MARPRSDIAPRILHAARDRFLSEGVDGASLRGIASAAGTSIGMVYYYFPTKDDLFLAVVEECYAGILQDLERALDPARSVEDRVRDFYSRLGRMSAEETLVVRIVVREVLVSNQRRQSIAERFARGHLPLVLRLVSDGMASGVFRTDVSPSVLAIAIMALAVFPQVMRRLVGDGFPLAALLPQGEGLSAELAAVILGGVEPRVEAAAATR